MIEAGTHHELVLLSIVGNFRNGNVTGDILGLRGGPYTQNVIRTGYKFNLREF